jgi:hypothetical protein
MFGLALLAWTTIAVPAPGGPPAMSLWGPGHMSRQAAPAPEPTKFERILLIPLDSRPAAGQFSQMIGRLTSADILMPPYEVLGRYTQNGSPEAILDWLKVQDFSQIDAVVVSTDMIAFGGLIASRVPDVSLQLAKNRLNRLAIIRRRAPKTKFYAYSAVMRLYPTSTLANRAWRIGVGRYAEIKERYSRAKSPADLQRLTDLASKLPLQEIRRYEGARARNHELQKTLIHLTAKGDFDYLVLGQDDAKPNGPHIPETARLKRLVESLAIGGRVYFCEGIDQLSNVLVSRALLRASGWTPKVRFVFSDPAGRRKVAAYESKSIELSLRDQVVASGARPMASDNQYDYTIFLNTPKPAELPFQAFLAQLAEEVDQGFPASVADINLAVDGTADPKLFEVLQQNERMMRLLSYAGWNTAGNTMGTAIPAANVYLLARRRQTPDLAREVAQKEFLLHRFVNDFDFHKYTRPKAYELIDAMPQASREETYGEAFQSVNEFVKRDLAQHLEATFKDQFLGKKFFAGTKQYVFTNLESVKIFLPWPRAYEVRLEFTMQTQEVAPSAGGQPQAPVNRGAS